MKEIRKITKLEINEALAKSAWDLGNKVLYKLCSEHPLHNTDEEIIAKIWLIGRSYAVAIERHKSKISDPKGDKFYEKKVAPKIRHSEIDKWFAQLKKDRTPENAIQTHSKLTELFWKISELKKRSLASKYLHFHRPDLFFIFDSRTVVAIQKVTPKEPGKDYEKFYRRCLWLQQDLKKRHGHNLSPRELDKVLLYIADSKKK